MQWHQHWSACKCLLVTKSRLFNGVTCLQQLLPSPQPQACSRFHLGPWSHAQLHYLSQITGVFPHMHVNDTMNRYFVSLHLHLHSKSRWCLKPVSTPATSSIDNVVVVNDWTCSSLDRQTSCMQHLVYAHLVGATSLSLWLQCRFLKTLSTAPQQ